MTIREDTKGRILLTGLRTVTIESMEDLLTVLNYGSTIRQTDSTAINAISSRSHAVFSVNLVQRKNRAQPAAVNKRFSMPVEALTGAEDWVTTDSKLHFVDLAGSERLKNTGASGERAKEGISINAGLASLGKVISQLSSRHSGSHVSYRDSKLTRLLQDSLGGNAITYMIACVTPAEFHLSETLNTVQYAQRARAIQSKPQIQHTSDDSDKQAVIDRLRAEVSFLRQQIRSSEGGSHAPQDRGERQNEREIELQNHLLDVQENYTALSQRHARLISEITKARSEGETGETPTLKETIGDSAVERLKRSNSFAEAVEQVVLEYEKTIQSLETSLSNTRSTLASTESTLLEKENKCAYVETLNQQLQNRCQKLMDREASNEQYLHNLEAKLDGQTSGDDRTSAVVSELRKEIARIRENEAQCEEYISTLEERLAEADQDLDLKQRELDRLEGVVERQRSLGKLDNLLYEFDHLQQNGHADQALHHSLPNGVPKSSTRGHKRRLSTLEEAANTAMPESDDEEDGEEVKLPNGVGLHEEEKDMDTPKAKGRSPAPQQEPLESPAQARAVATKLEDVTQELFDLRISHEATVNEYDNLTVKYEQALNVMSELQDRVDEDRHAKEHENVASPPSTRPTSFLGDARVTELKERGPLPSSRSLSSELSLAGDSSTSLENESPRSRNRSGDLPRSSLREEVLLREIEDLKRSHAEKDESLANVNGNFSELQVLYNETVDIVEDLRTENLKAKAQSPTTPTSPVIRRKSSQNVMTIDRAHRSLASLKNIAAEKFEHDDDTMQSFELNLNTAMHELHQRSERVQLLEGEIAMVKKDMDNKNSMISGLTRERSSIKATSPIMDMSVMTTMNDQLMQREGQMRELQEQHAAREQELQVEIESLKGAVQRAEAAKSSIPGFFPETPATSNEADRQLGHGSSATEQAARLMEENANLKSQNQARVLSMKESETRLIATISELEATLTAVERMKNEAEERARQTEKRLSTAGDMTQQNKDHLDTIKGLQRELDEHKATSATHVDKIARLAQLQEAGRGQEREAAAFRESSERNLDSHRQRIADLEQQVEEHQADVDFHKHGLKSLHDSHARHIEGLHTTIRDHESTRSDMDRELQNMKDAHTGHLTRLESELIDLKAQLERSKGGLADELEQSRATCKRLESQRDDLARHAEELKSEMTTINRTNKNRIAEMEALRAEKDRAVNLVEDLEEQLNNSYDQQQANTSRLSLMSSTHNSQQQAVNDANAAMGTLQKQLESSQNQVETLQVCLLPFPFLPNQTGMDNAMLTKSSQSQLRESQQIDRSSSAASNLRKSTSVASLPSPPPAIPLPPLPAGAIASPASANFNPTSPPSRPTDSGQHQSLAEISSLQQTLSDKENHIKQMEKHLFAEKQLTATLEEALMDLENQGKNTKKDMDSYKKRCFVLEDELSANRKESRRMRDSMQAVEEEKGKRLEAERAREKLEQQMRALDGGKKKKKGGFNCF